MAASDPVASTTEPSAKGEDAAPSALPSKWTYNEQMDEMRGTVTKTARLTSSNEVNLQFPYGTVSGYIEVRKRPTDGLNVMFLVDKGQILCRSYSDRSEEHTSELQSLMRISYAVFCLKKKKKINN